VRVREEKVVNGVMRSNSVDSMPVEINSRKAPNSYK
jgi:hypothetical protein